MPEREVLIASSGHDLVATRTDPEGVCRAGLVLLHPSEDGSRRQFLFEDLATRLPRLGVSVLRYDRRPKVGGADVPIRVQVEDLRCALTWYRQELRPVPAGLWGFSQGAWIAMSAAAADPLVAFLILVGASTVSPAEQMRFGTAEQLRRAGYGPADIAELDRLRMTWEKYQRGQLPRGEAQALVDQTVSRPWFGLSWVPVVIPARRSWADMDFDPAGPIGRLGCPVLALYGDDEWVPVAESIDVWQQRLPDPQLLTVHRLPGTGHHPTLEDGRTISTISPQYVDALDNWLRDQLARSG